MAKGDKSGLVLGLQIPVPQDYAPHILHAIPRATARQQLGIGRHMPFHGVDVWHAYEMSWLDSTGKPLVRVGRFSVPAHSPNIVESKSFKLYLNSLNNTRFDSVEEAHSTIVADISGAAGEGVALELLTIGDFSLSGSVLPGECLDELPITLDSGAPRPELLQVQPDHRVEEVLYSHVLRSLCPVTSQPDWATVWLHYAGAAIEHSSLLQYIIAYREHQEFHEQCVERMFCDVTQRCAPEFLQLQAFYTRRGGLDINPFRSTDPDACPLPRLNRQ